VEISPENSKVKFFGCMLEKKGLKELNERVWFLQTLAISIR